MKTRLLRNTRNKTQGTIFEEEACLSLKMSHRSTKLRRLIDRTLVRLKIVLLREWLRTKTRKLPNTNSSISLLKVPDKLLRNQIKVEMEPSSGKLTRFKETILNRMMVASFLMAVICWTKWK